ncbi:MAG: response regulator [Lachnospiraceae bacterium]|nr:response regulator [Lachnospiraceae bacterium]
MNILFVDDQSNVLSSVLTSVDWRGHGFSSVFSASSAIRAKEIIKEHPVDILVTDIEMPGEDGLSLITWVRENQYDMECVVLTSHADFFYAQQAISLQITGYVLQPARSEDLLKVVDQARSNIENRKKVRADKSSSGFSKAAYYTAVKNFFDSWPTYAEFIAVPGLFSKKTQALREFDFNCSEDTSVIFLCTHVTKWRDLPLAPYVLLEEYHNIVSSVMKQAHYSALSYFHTQNIYFTMLYPAPEDDDSLMSYLDTVQDNILHELKCEVRITACSGDLIEMKDIILALLKSDEELTRRGAAKLTAPQQITLSAYSGDTRKDSSTDYLAQVEKYIADNISESITRTQIANALFVSPGYIGAIVKAKLGCSCKELIVREKMKYAKHLLHNTALPIGEIAKNCGYDSFAYFSKVYKDNFGVSPSAERKGKQSPNME